MYNRDKQGQPRLPTMKKRFLLFNLQIVDTSKRLWLRTPQLGRICLSAPSVSKDINEKQTFSTPEFEGCFHPIAGNAALKERDESIFLRTLCTINFSKPLEDVKQPRSYAVNSNRSLQWISFSAFSSPQRNLSRETPFSGNFPREFSARKAKAPSVINVADETLLLRRGSREKSSDGHRDRRDSPV